MVPSCVRGDDARALYVANALSLVMHMIVHIHKVDLCLKLFFPHLYASKVGTDLGVSRPALLAAILQAKG